MTINIKKVSYSNPDNKNGSRKDALIKKRWQSCKDYNQNKI